MSSDLSQGKGRASLRRPILESGSGKTRRWSAAAEQEQGAIRIAISLTFLIYLLFDWPESQDARGLWEIGVVFIGSYLAVAVVLFSATFVWQTPSRSLRVVGIISDLGALSYGLYLSGPMGAPWYGVYLWVTLGNGFRYGEKYLYLSGAVSLVCFGLVVMNTPYWHSHKDLALGLEVTLLVIPAYSAVLIRRLSEARQRADAASRAKSEFLSRMSHEIRTPLNGILGMTDLLRTRPLQPEDKEYVETIHASGRTLAHQIDDILDLSKIEAGELSLEYVEFDLYALINTTLRIFEPQVFAKRLQLQETINPRTPFLVYGDPHKLRQIIINLVGNAIKFTQDGFISLRVYPRETNEAGEVLRFEVADTGTGIAEDALHRIFEPFAQADSSVSRNYGGTGLGTTICKHLVELMGGSIGVQSTLTVGTTFWFDVPFRSTAPGIQDRNHVWTRDCRVLYLSSSKVGAQSVEPALRKWRMPLKKIINLEEAKQFVRAAQPGEDVFDALILDGVGHGNGLESLMALLEGDHSFTSMPVVLVGAEHYPPDITNRVHDRLFVLPRPVEDRVLFNTLHACYSRRSTEDDIIHIARAQTREVTASRSLNVLIGDDNATNRLVLQRMLEKMGHHCASVTGGEAILAALEGGDFNVAIVDKNMPDMGGIDVFSAYCMANGGESPVTFVVLTADATAEAKEECFAAGIRHFLTKPVSLAKLQEVLGQATEDEPVPVEVDTRRPKTPALAIPVIDDEEFEKLELLAGGDRAFLHDMIANFERDAAQDLADIETALASNDWQGFKDSAHALKGAALYLGLKQLAALSAEAQNYDRTTFASRGMQAAQELKQAAAIAIDHLQERLGSVSKLG
jgi:two-component system sensor histidine kinase RpfC